MAYNEIRHRFNAVSRDNLSLNANSIIGALASIVKILYKYYLIRGEIALKSGVPACFSKSNTTVSAFVIIAPASFINSSPFW